VDATQGAYTITLPEVQKEWVEMSCSECRARLYPDNPTVPQWNPRTGQQHQPLCYSCSNYEAPTEDIPDPFILWENGGTRAERKSTATLERDLAVMKGKVNYLMTKQSQRESKGDML